MAGRPKLQRGQIKTAAARAREVPNIFPDDSIFEGAPDSMPAEFSDALEACTGMARTLWPLGHAGAEWAGVFGRLYRCGVIVERHRAARVITARVEELESIVAALRDYGRIGPGQSTPSTDAVLQELRDIAAAIRKP